MVNAHYGFLLCQDVLMNMEFLETWNEQVKGISLVLLCFAESAL